MTWDESSEFVRQSIESHDRQIGELTDRLVESGLQIAENGRQIAENGRQVYLFIKAMTTMVRVSNEDATAIQSLARIAETHEKRISDLEENR